MKDDTDIHRRPIEAISTRNATSSAVIEELRSLFVKFRLAESLVTDNGTCFVSAEFEAFLADNGIKHLTSALYHPASNSLAKCAVQIIKKESRSLRALCISVSQKYFSLIALHLSRPQVSLLVSYC